MITSHALVAVLLSSTGGRCAGNGYECLEYGNLDMDCLRRINDCPREGFRSLRVEEVFGSWMTCKAAFDMLRDVSPHAWRGSFPPFADFVRSADCHLASQPS